MRIIGLIPVRGGSKGIPRKNLQNINGIPLVAHKIIQAKKSLCNEVWVSTEDEEIKKVAAEFGASLINRPIDLATDEASTDSVLKHAVKILKVSKEDVLVLLQATSPLIKLESINNCINKLINNARLGSVLTLRESHPFMWVTKDDLIWEPSGHERQVRKRRQELDVSGWETGGCYAIKIGHFKEKNVRYPEPTGAVAVSHLESLDIDTIDELETASQILKIYGAS
jgi:CMP-N-acetylneuraminic acid synthetase